VFGLIRFQSAGFWEAKRRFAPIGREIEFIISAGAQGPTERHREFFRELESRYSELETAIKPMLLDQICGFPGESDPIESDAGFQLDGFDVPDTSASPFTWELVFTTASDDHYFCVVMEEWVPVEVRVDG